MVHGLSERSLSSRRPIRVKPDVPRRWSELLTVNLERDSRVIGRHRIVSATVSYS